MYSDFSLLIFLLTTHKFLHQEETVNHRLQLQSLQYT